MADTPFTEWSGALHKIVSRRQSVGAMPQRTQASLWSDRYSQRYESEAKAMVPRSQRSWEQEMQRPGSWESGVGTLSPSGQGSFQRIGIGRRRFDFTGDGM